MLNFRVITFGVPSGFREDLHTEAQNAALFDGVDGTVYQMDPSIFFILCRYVDKVYKLIVVILTKIKGIREAKEYACYSVY